MTPTTRTEIKRENAQHSTGPNPPEGKANRRQARLTGQLVVLPSEDHAAHTAFSKSFFNELQPKTQNVATPSQLQAELKRIKQRNPTTPPTMASSLH